MSNFLLQPSSTKRLAVYLKDFLNTQFQEEIKASNGTINSSVIVVRSYRGYDDFNVPLTEFPLLKVYKNRDIFKRNTLFRSSLGAITYSVNYPDLEILPNLLDWVGFQINKGLLNYEHAEHDLLPPPNNTGYSCEYLLSFNEMTQQVYPFLRFNLEFKNFWDVQDYK